MEPQQIPSENGPVISSEPTKKMNISIPAAIITGAAIIALAIIFTLGGSGSDVQKQPPPSTDTTPKIVSADVVTLRDDDYIRGNREAEIIVFEYADSDCSFCQTFHPTMMKVLNDYKGKVAWVQRFFPLNRHPNAYTEAVALSCVGELGGNDTYWTYLDSIINITLNPDPKSNEMLKTLAMQQGIDGKLFTACAKDPAIAKRIDAETAEAQAIGARGTPFSVVVNTKTKEQAVLAGAYPIENVKETIDSLLK